MITHVEATRLKDERLIQAVRSAEQTSGFRTGIRYSEQGRHLVQVSLVPRSHWWICGLDDENRLCNRRIMTAEDYARTSERPRH